LPCRIGLVDVDRTLTITCTLTVMTLMWCQGGAASCDESDTGESFVTACAGETDDSMAKSSVTAADTGAQSQTQSSLVDALLLVPSSPTDTPAVTEPGSGPVPGPVPGPSTGPSSTNTRPRRLHVPYIVSVCCQHLQTHGQSVGLQLISLSSVSL